MAPPPPHHSTPPSASQAPRSSMKAGRSSSHARAASDEFLSPVSKFNRTKEQLRKEQEERMKALPGDRVGRLARLSAPAATSSAKRKLTELETAAAATATANESKAKGRATDRVKKSRTSSPTRRNQQPRATASKRAVSDAHSHQSTLSASALKRHDERHSRKAQSDANDHGTAAAAADAEQRYLSYAHAQQRMSLHSTQSQRSSVGGAQGLFSRHADPSVLKTPPESTTSSPFKFPGYESSAPSSPLPIIRTPPRGDGALPIQLTPRGDDGMVDLERVPTVAGLETVEGDDILSTLMTMTTPRVGRHFPSEHARTASEEREIQFLRRRRLAAARRSIDMKRPLVTDDVVNNNDNTKAKWDFDGELEPVSTPSMRRRVASRDAQQARDDAEDAKAQVAENDDILDEDEDDDDDETTETKVARFSQAKRWSLRRFALWILVGAGFLCVLDVALPLALSLFEPPKPFCDGNTSMLGEMGGENTALRLIDNSQFTALQPYREECRACPLFGVCSNGVLESCLPPLEERNGACVESKEVQYALEQIAMSIEKHVVHKATAQVCGSTPQLPSLWGDESAEWNFEELTQVVVLLSELKELVLHSPFAETLMNISLAAATGNAAAEYVFNRSLDLALSSFQKIAQVGFEKMSQYVGSSAVDRQGSDMVIQFSTAIAPWRCRARNQLITHAHLIAIAVATFALATLLYRRWLVYKTKRALVDRLVKEVRYFLLGRSHRTERFYPANHLRDNLFDTLPNVSPGDRKWLRESVWPTVASIVAEDSRVHCHIAPIHGKQMVVWEWISSNSPNNKTEEQKQRIRTRNARKRYSI